MAVGVLSLVRDTAEIALWVPALVERLLVPEVPEDEVVGPEDATWSGGGSVGGLWLALNGLRHLLDPQ